MATKPTETPTVSVTFTRPHRHGGKAYAKGDTLEVSERERKKLVERGVVSG